MGLQVWLPLNGNLENQGLSNVTITNNSATVDNNGKIGKCYYFNGSSSYIDIAGVSLNNIWSYGCWFKSAASSRTWEGLIILNKNGGDADMQLGFYTYPTGSKYQTTANGQYNSTLPHTYDNQWHHLFATFDGVNLKTYKDGVLVNTKIITASLLQRTKLTIGARCKGSSYDCYYQGYVNDFRIYDHCLSPKEVEEIAKGLVLHYKLHDRFYEATTNLCQSLVAGGQTAVSNGIITTTGNNADTYWYIKPKEALVGGDKYTLSCYVTGFNNSTTSLTFGVGSQSGDNCAGYWSLKNGYNTFTFTMPAGKNGSTANFIFDDNGGSRTQILTISKVQLEKKDHATPFTNYGATRTPTTIYDSSGYSHNGTITGSLTAAAGSPRYGVATQYPDSACSIGIGNLSTMVPEGNFTFNIWFKKKTGEWGSKNYETILGGPSGFELEMKVSGTNSPVLKLYSWGGGTFTYTLDEWHMLTMVRTPSDSTYYMDGVQILTGTAGTIPSGDYFIGSWKTATSQNYRGYLSDARIYATVLTPDQIKELYNTSMSVDSNGNIHARELVEL